jgi:cell division protein FtsX
MKTKEVPISIDLIIEMLKNLNEEAKQEIFERVYLEEDTSPLTAEEKEAIKMAEEEIKRQETIKWPFGK